MFELPDAKRVRREDLDSSSEDEAPVRDDKQDAELLAKLHARMAGMLDLGSIEQQPAAATPKKTKPAPKPKTEDVDDSQSEDDGADDGDREMKDKPDEPEEFEFRLFSSAPITKIALVDEDELALAKEGDMLRRRPMAYYIAEESPEAKSQFAEAAVDGEEVLARAKQRWWGMEQPWRVTTITNTAKAGGKGAAASDEEETARRRRPGKKKRIALRMREREKKKKAEEEEKAKMSKEEALKEKKKRLNRIKKLRKRAKEKAAKQGGGADGEDAGSGSGSGSDDGDE